MNRNQAERILSRVIENAEVLMQSRSGKLGVERFRAYPVELVALYVYGSYLKREVLNDLDLIATYNYMSDEEQRLALLMDSSGVDTYQMAKKKLVAPYSMDLVHLVLKPVDYNFRIRTILDGKPMGDGLPIDTYSQAWFNTELML